MSYSAKPTESARRAAATRLLVPACLLVALFDASDARTQPDVQQATLRKLNAALGPGSLDDRGTVLKLWMKAPNEAGLEELVRAFPMLKGIVLHEMDGDLSPQVLRPLERLPHLESLSLGTPLTDEWAEAVGRLQGLKHLAIHAGPITARGARALSRLTGVESLVASGGILGPKRDRDGDLAVTIRAFPQIRQLTLAGPQVSGETMREVGRLKALTNLTMLVTENVTAHDFRHVRNLSQLEVILFQTRITDDWLAHIAPLKSLRRVEISRAITDRGLVHLAGLTNLQQLRITSDTLTDESLAALQNLTRLRELELYSPLITGSGLEYLRRLKQLHRLKLHKTGIQPEHVPHLTRLAGLRTLDVSWTPLEKDDHWKSLAVLRSLENLELIEIELRPEDREALSALLPGCRVHYAE